MKGYPPFIPHTFRRQGEHGKASGGSLEGGGRGYEGSISVILGPNTVWGGERTRLTRRRRKEGTASMSKDSEMSASDSASICLGVRTVPPFGRWL